MKCNWFVTSTFTLLLSSYSAAATLSSNLSSAAAGTESVSGSSWIAEQFLTDGSSYVLSSATLLLQNLTPGTATLDLYRDAAGAPGTLAGVLTSPTTYSSSLSLTTFGGNSLLLQPNSAYWLVLTSSAGDFEWAWTQSSAGSGVGFEPDWAATDDSGVTWYTGNSDPQIASVTANPIASAVPEPSANGMLLLAVMVAAAGLIARNAKRAY